MLSFYCFLQNLTKFQQLQVKFFFAVFKADAKITPSYFLGPTDLGLPRLVQKRGINYVRKYARKSYIVVALPPKRARLDISRSYFSNILYVPNITNLGLYNFGPILSS